MLRTHLLAIPWSLAGHSFRACVRALCERCNSFGANVSRRKNGGGQILGDALVFLSNIRVDPENGSELGAQIRVADEYDASQKTISCVIHNDSA